MSREAEAWSHQDRFRFRGTMELFAMEAHFDAGRESLIKPLLEIHHPLFENGDAVGCAACDWDQSGQDEWPCPTARLCGVEAAE